jgi:superfamily II DNA or RNA helicase
VQIAIALITLTQAAAADVLWMAPTTALVVLAVGVGLTLVTALLAAWGPTRVRPLAVLNARG